MSARLAQPTETAICFMIRTEVFVHGQGVPAMIVIDGRDPECAQFITSVGDYPAGTARLRFTGDGEAKAERVAVLEQFRGQGLGVALMVAIEREAAKRGYSCVVLHSQDSAIGFYESIGYVVEGAPFTEAEIIHLKMRKSV